MLYEVITILAGIPDVLFDRGMPMHRHRKLVLIMLEIFHGISVILL